PGFIGQYLLSEALRAGLVPYTFERMVPGSDPRLVMRQLIQQVHSLLQMESHFHLIRGVAFLEIGDLARAREQFARANALSSGAEPAKGRLRVPLELNVRHLSRMYLEWLDTK